MRTDPRLRRLALPGLVAALFATAAAASGAWKPGDANQGDGFSYQIFSQESGEGFVRYQARGTIRAQPEVLVRSVRVVASDPDRAPRGQRRRLVSSDDGAFVVHTRIDLPAFFSDRDIVTRGVSSIDPDTGGHRIDWEAIEHAEVPPIDGTIRIVRSAGFWDFVPRGDGSSEAVYETYVDLGGSLPGWLVQPMMGKMVGGTFEDVAREALSR